MENKKRDLINQGSKFSTQNYVHIHHFNLIKKAM